MPTSPSCARSPRAPTPSHSAISIRPSSASLQGMRAHPASRRSTAISPPSRRGRCGVATSTSSSRSSAPSAAPKRRAGLAGWSPQRSGRTPTAGSSPSSARSPRRRRSRHHLRRPPPGSASISACAPSPAVPMAASSRRRGHCGAMPSGSGAPRDGCRGGRRAADAARRPAGAWPVCIGASALSVALSSIRSRPRSRAIATCS